MPRRTKHATTHHEQYNTDDGSGRVVAWAQRPSRTAPVDDPNRGVTVNRGFRRRRRRGNGMSQLRRRLEILEERFNMSASTSASSTVTSYVDKREEKQLAPTKPSRTVRPTPKPVTSETEPPTWRDMRHVSVLKRAQSVPVTAPHTTVPDSKPAVEAEGYDLLDAMQSTVVSSVSVSFGYSVRTDYFSRHLSTVVQRRPEQFTTMRPTAFKSSQTTIPREESTVQPDTRQNEVHVVDTQDLIRCFDTAMDFSSV